MDLRPFGDTGLKASVLGFGGGHLGSSRLDDEGARRLVDTALDLGVTFLDTARGYGDSEERLGRYLRGRRDQVVLSTKVGYDVEGERDWTAAAVTKGVDRALRTLQTDVLDVVFLHSCSLDVLKDGAVVEALLECREAGKVRVPAYSGENEELAWAAQSGAFGALQTSVNLVDQWSARKVLPEAADRGLGIVAKRPVANVAWRHESRPEGVYGELYWERFQSLGLQPGTDDWVGTAIRFAAFTPGVTTAIVGTSKPANLAAAVEAIERGPLSEDERLRWEEAFTPHLEEWPGDV